MEQHGTRAKRESMGAGASGTGRAVVAVKPFRMFGVDYKPGDPVDVSHLPDHKVGQLMNQRYLRPVDPDTAAPQPG